MIRHLACILTLILAGPALALDPAGRLPSFLGTVQGTGVPGLDGQPLMLWNAPADPKNFDARPTLRIDRHVNAGSGQPWYTYKGLWVLGSTNHANQGFEWVLTSELHNNALASTGSQNVAINGTAWKKKVDGDPVGPVGTTWAGNFNCVDQTGEVDPVASCIGIEVDVSGKGGDKNRQRVGIHVAGGGAPGAHAGYGVLISPTEGGTIDRAIALQTPGASFGIGLDLAPVAFSGPAVNLGPNQWIALDGDAQGAFHHFIGFSNGKILLAGPAGPALAASADGLVEVGRVRELAPHVPTSASSPCQPGERAWDQNFEYRCIAPNSWKRATLSDW